MCSTAGAAATVSPGGERTTCSTATRATTSCSVAASGSTRYSTAGAWSPTARTSSSAAAGTTACSAAPRTTSSTVAPATTRWDFTVTSSSSIPERTFSTAGGGNDFFCSRDFLRG